LQKAEREREEQTAKFLQQLSAEYQIRCGLESDVASLMERVRALEAARPPPGDRLLNQEAAAALIGVKSATLASWRSLGKGPSYIKVGRSAFYKAADIEHWLNAQAVVPIPKADYAK
jgi:predicted DNA-binding transcriptional regulator AlpA